MEAAAVEPAPPQNANWLMARDFRRNWLKTRCPLVNLLCSEVHWSPQSWGHCGDDQWSRQRAVALRLCTRPRLLRVRARLPRTGAPGTPRRPFTLTTPAPRPDRTLSVRARSSATVRRASFEPCGRSLWNAARSSVPNADSGRSTARSSQRSFSTGGRVLIQVWTSFELTLPGSLDSAAAESKSRSRRRSLTRLASGAGASDSPTGTGGSCWSSSSSPACTLHSHAM